MTIMHACGVLGWGFEAAVLVGLSMSRVAALFDRVATERAV